MASTLSPPDSKRSLVPKPRAYAPPQRSDVVDERATPLSRSIC